MGKGFSKKSMNSTYGMCCEQKITNTYFCQVVQNVKCKCFPEIKIHANFIFLDSGLQRLQDGLCKYLPTFISDTKKRAAVR